jgi:hypothetical protein
MATPDEVDRLTQVGLEAPPNPLPRGGSNKSWDRQTQYGDDVTHAFIQWKGTDVCMDFYCSCGGYGHIDGMFAYYVKCADCGQVYASPAHISNFVPLLEGEEPDHEPFVAYDDSDEWGSKC